MILGGSVDKVLHKACRVLLRPRVKGEVRLENGRVEPDVLRHPASGGLEIRNKDALQAAALDLFHAAVRHLNLIIVLILDDRFTAPEKALEVEMLVIVFRKPPDALVHKPAVYVDTVVEGGDFFDHTVSVPITEIEITDLRIGHGEVNGQFCAYRAGQGRPSDSAVASLSASRLMPSPKVLSSRYSQSESTVGPLSLVSLPPDGQKPWRIRNIIASNIVST